MCSKVGSDWGMKPGESSRRIGCRKEGPASQPPTAARVGGKSRIISKMRIGRRIVIRLGRSPIVIREESWFRSRRKAPPPPFFLSADSKGFTRTRFLSAHSKELSLPRLPQQIDWGVTEKYSEVRRENPS